MNTEAGGPGGSFESRLQAARTKQGLDTPPKPTGRDPAGLGSTPWGLGLRVGVEMVSALVVAIAIGYGLDRALGTRPFLLLVFLPLGVAAGVMNVWRLIGRGRIGDGQSGGRGT